MSGALARFQSDFVAALFDPGSPATLTAQPAFAVYRNTVVNGCLDALAANFPSVQRLVGNLWFRAAASAYLALEPPRDARMLLYGGGFADFLTGFAPARDLPYLADVARLDRRWIETHVAADAASVDGVWLAGLAPAALGGLHLAPHPAARWGWFAQAPIYSIWQRNRGVQPADEPMAQLVWKGEGALLTRPSDDVTWQRVDQSHCAFLDACKEGLVLEAAAGAALQVQPDADIAGLLAQLLRSGALTHPITDQSADT